MGSQEELLIEGCKGMTRYSLELCKEFEHIDAEMDWKWISDDMTSGEPDGN